MGSASVLSRRFKYRSAAMAEEDVPSDLDVRLEWPHVESPPVSKLPKKERRAAKATKARVAAGALVPKRRTRGGPADELMGRMEDLTRAVERLQADQGVDLLAGRVNDLADTIIGQRKDEAKRSASQAKRTGEQLKGLAKRVDSIARAVEAMPAPTDIAEMLGRVDALASAVEMLSSQTVPNDRLDALRDQIAVSFEPLQEATAEIRRLNETVLTSLVARSDRQSELRAQIDKLAGEVRSLRRRLPVQSSGEGVAVVDAVAAAVRDALGAEAKPAVKRSRSGRASTGSG